MKKNHLHNEAVHHKQHRNSDVSIRDQESTNKKDYPMDKIQDKQFKNQPEFIDSENVRKSKKGGNLVKNKNMLEK